MAGTVGRGPRTLRGRAGFGSQGRRAVTRLLNDERFALAAFIAETPLDEPRGEERKVRVLKSLVG